MVQPCWSRNVAVDFADLLSDMTFAAMGIADARYGRFVLVINAVTLTVKEKRPTPRGIVFTAGEAKLAAVQLGMLGFGRVWQAPSVALDLGAGLRSWWFESKIRLDPAPAVGCSF